MPSLCILRGKYSQNITSFPEVNTGQPDYYGVCSISHLDVQSNPRECTEMRELHVL